MDHIDEPIKYAFNGRISKKGNIVITLFRTDMKDSSEEEINNIFEVLKPILWEKAIPQVMLKARKK